MWFSLVTDQTGATSSSLEFGSNITNPDCEKGDMAVVKKLIKGCLVARARQHFHSKELPVPYRWQIAGVQCLLEAVVTFDRLRQACL